MEHIVTIAFDFDDKTVTKHIEDTVEKAVIDKITTDVEERLFTKDVWRSRNVKVDPENDPLSAWTKHIVEDIFLEYKDEFINKAAEILADSYKRTKAWKETAQASLAKEVENENN